MIWVVLSAWNEAQVIAPLIDAIGEVARRDAEPWRVVVVDDGSTDDTHAIAVRAGIAAGFAIVDADSGLAPAGGGRREGDFSLTVLRHPENRGLGAGLQTGFGHVLAHAQDDDVIVTLDADLTHPPAQIPTLVARVREGHDRAIARRDREVMAFADACDQACTHADNCGVPVCDFGRLPTQASPSFHTGVFDHSTRFMLPILFSLNRFARPNVTPRSLMSMNGLAHGICCLRFAAFFPSPFSSSRQTSRCCSGFESLCCMKTASSFRASRSARLAPPDSSSTRSSSAHDQPSSG